jgi:hypothetical protein
MMTKPGELQGHERKETIEELTHLLTALQDMGRRLATETHEAAYDDVLKLNELFHQAHLLIDVIRIKADQD